MEKSISVKIILVIGVIICLALGSIGVYHMKVNKKGPVLNEEKNISSTIIDEISSTIIDDNSSTIIDDNSSDYSIDNSKYTDSFNLGIKDFPKEQRDASEITLSDFVIKSVKDTFFTNYKSEFKNMKFNSSCFSYCDNNGVSNREYYNCEEDEKNTCSVAEVLIDDKLQFNTYGSKLYVNDKYIFLIKYNMGGISQQSITVYDKNYNIIFQQGLIFTEIFDKNDNDFSTEVVIKEDVLHYFTISGKIDDGTVKYVKVDLNKSPIGEEIVTIFKAGYSYEG